MKTARFLTATYASEISIESDLTNIRMINRTRMEDNKISEMLESGSLTYQDPPGIRASIQSFSNRINELRYYNCMGGTGMTQKRPEGSGFPIPLDYVEIKDAVQGEYLVVSLEGFDAMEFTSFRNENRMQIDSNGNEYSVNVTLGELALSGTAYWRMYSSVTAEILNETVISEKLILNVQGINRQNAVEKIVERTPEYYQKLGVILGQRYADRISPRKTYIGRHYYANSRSCSNLKDAVPFVKANEWESARLIWEEAIDRVQKPKDLAKLYLNMGVYYEQMGDLDKAISQLELAMIENEKRSKGYLSLLIKARDHGYE